MSNLFTHNQSLPTLPHPLVNKTNLQAKETAFHLLLCIDYWDSYLLEGNLSLPGKVCIKEEKRNFS